jgi:potassium/hydrogen antiporter
MALFDSVSLTILLGAVIILAGILSSLIALRFGAPLLLAFLVVGMLAGKAGPGGIHFDDVRLVYTVGSMALALILFDGGLRTRLQTFRSVLAPAGTLATVGVLLTAALTAPIAMFSLGLNVTEGLLVGAMVGSTDAAAVFFLIHTRGLRLRPRVAATLEVESATNDPFAVFLTIELVEVLLVGDQPWTSVAGMLAEQALVGAAIGVVGGRAIVITLNRVALPQGLHAPFVTTAALVIFAFAAVLHASGFLAAYLAGLIVGNRPTRAHGTLVVFLDAVTWLAQIVMFVLLGLLAWPGRLASSLGPGLMIAAGLMFLVRPAAVFACLTPFAFPWRDTLFISWVGLRGAVGIFLASIPLLVQMPRAQLYFDIVFVVVVVSLLVQGWTLAAAARALGIAFPRRERIVRRVELDLPGQLAQELVGYAVEDNSPYLRRGVIPAWAKPTLVIRDERVLTAAEAGRAQRGDYVYVLAPPERARSLDRFFAEMDTLPAAADPRLQADFYVPGTATLEMLAQIYGFAVDPAERAVSLADEFAGRLGPRVQRGAIVRIGPIVLIAHKVTTGRVSQVGLQLAAPDPPPVPAPRRGAIHALRALGRRLVAVLTLS